MNKKIILGLLSVDTYNEKEIFTDIMRKEGFEIFSISDKIKEIAKYLLKTNENSKITDEFINDQRKKAYSINKLFWTNFLVTSINCKGNILIVDLWDEDLYGGYVYPIVSDQILCSNYSHSIFPKALSNESVRNLIEEITYYLYNKK